MTLRTQSFMLWIKEQTSSATAGAVTMRAFWSTTPWNTLTTVACWWSQLRETMLQGTSFTPLHTMRLLRLQPQICWTTQLYSLTSGSGLKWQRLAWGFTQPIGTTPTLILAAPPCRLPMSLALLLSFGVSSQTWLETGCERSLGTLQMI